MQDSQISLLDKATLFIRLGCVQYSGNDSLRNYQRARNLLKASPEIAEFSFYTALVSNDVETVSKFLKSDAKLAVTIGGPLGWLPLLYVIYSRIGERKDTRNSLSIVAQLLDTGANPDSHVMLNEIYRFTALTGAMGEGEQGVNQPPHQFADEIAELLLNAGADPNERQGLYNTMFTDSGDKWLALMLSKGLKASDALNRNDSGKEAYITTMDYQLSSAVDRNRIDRVRLLLNAGANPNARCTYNDRAMHTNALLAGYTTLTQILEEYGAKSENLNIKEQFELACVHENYRNIESLLDSNPTLCEDATLLHSAAENASAPLVMAMIERGFDINGQSKHGRTLLHNFALDNDVTKIHEFLRHGARTDIRDHSHNSTAAGFAAYSASYEAMRLLLNSTSSLLDVVCCAYLERAKVLFDKDATLLHQKTEQGNTMLHLVGSWLHDEPDSDTYKTLVEWLLNIGADINETNKQNQTPVQFNVANGSDTLAEVLSSYC